MPMPQFRSLCLLALSKALRKAVFALGLIGVLLAALPLPFALAATVAPRIAAGDEHSVALLADGTLRTWGHNNFGQLGNGGTTDRLTPGAVALPPAETISAIAAGGFHNLALTSNNVVYAWGWNAFGQLGNGTTVDQTSPVIIALPGGRIPIGIAAGRAHSLVLASDGTVYAFGSNSEGQLGNGATNTVTSPVQVQLPAGCLGAEIGAGLAHSTAICQTSAVRAVYSWGRNSEGQVGDGTTTRRLTPTLTIGFPTSTGGFDHLAAGGDHTLVTASDPTNGRRLYAWGSNDFGQLGDGTTTNRTSAIVVAQPSGVAADRIVSLSAGISHSALALDFFGGNRAFVWGRNVEGEVGDGTTTSRATPTEITTLAGTAVVLDASGFHTLAIEGDGRVKAWGFNFFGQVGDGSKINRSSPVQVAGPFRVFISCGTTLPGFVNQGAALADSLSAADCVSPERYLRERRVSFAKRYNFTLSATHKVNIAMLSDELDPFLYLYDSAGDVLAQNDDCDFTGSLGGGSLNACVFDQTLDAGTYTVEATTYSVGKTGRYKLVMRGIKGDYNDTRADILWRDQASGANALWSLSSSGINLLDGRALPGVTTNWSIVGQGDFNGDGLTDILWRENTIGLNAIWFMNGSTITSAQFTAVSVDTSWSVVATGDFDGDGKDDILWRNVNGANVIWFMNGAAIASTASVPGVPANWFVGGVGDFNGDGKADVFWRDGSSGLNAIWLMDGATITASAFMPSADSSFTLKAVADLNGDGKADVFWRNANGANLVWIMNATTLVTLRSLPSVEAGSGYDIAVINDFNGDGRADVMWRRVDGLNLIWTLNADGTILRSGFLPTVVGTFQPVNR